MDITTSDIITYSSVAVIIVFFIYSMKEAYKVCKADKLLKSLTAADDPLSSLSESIVGNIAANYKKTITIPDEDSIKSNIPAADFFSEHNISKSHNVNLRMLDTASGTLVGLGLLGTFIGLTWGIYNFHSDTADQIQSSIQGLLDGMGTAFLTSLVGMSCSIVYTMLDKRWRNKLARSLFDLTEKLDSHYYIDDLTLMNISQQKMIDQLKAEVQKQTTALLDKLTYKNEEGLNVTIGNAIREILAENIQQTKALKSFSTDLAIELNQGFDEILSRQMQQRIIPLMESVDATTRNVVEHIDQMAKTVSSPAAEMMQNVVEELKHSMRSIINKFNAELSGSATSELENLARQLGTATQAMADFPKNMENISAALQVTIEEVKHAISEISNTSAHTSTAVMQQMQEQINFATATISDTIAEVKEVMTGLSHSSQEQSNQMTGKLADAADKMSEFLTATVSMLSASVQQSVKHITDKVNDQQAGLLALQEGTTLQTQKLLDSFNAGLERLEKMNEHIAATMNEFRLAQGEITASTSNLRTICGDMKLATELFSKGQNDSANKLTQLQMATQKNIDQIAAVLQSAGLLSEEYMRKFETIKNGLALIFSQVQNGLSEYSRTVRKTTDSFLEQYTSSLTQTAGALASAIERQNEVTEMLTDTIARKGHL